MRTLPLVLLLALAVLVPAARADVLESPDRATPIDVDRGRVLFSQRGRDGRFRLAIHPATGARYSLDVPPQDAPFQADLGNDAAGQPVVVYASCPSGPCDIRVFHLTTGLDAPVPAAARPVVDEHAPTIAKGRVVWATVTGQVPAAFPTGTAHVLTQMLGAADRPTTLPALPKRRCGVDFDRKRFCERPGGRVTEQELIGDRLAQVVVSGSRRTLSRSIEMRLVSVKERTSTQVTSIGAGEGGQQFIGPSWNDGRLYWYLACFGDPSGCGRSGGAYRYAPGSRRLERRLDGTQLAGFGVDGGRVYRADGNESRLCEIEQGAYPGLPGRTTGPCPITADPLPADWQPYSPRQR